MMPPKPGNGSLTVSEIEMSNLWVHLPAPLYLLHAERDRCDILWGIPNRRICPQFAKQQLTVPRSLSLMDGLL